MIATINWGVLKNEELHLFLQNILNYLTELHVLNKAESLSSDHLGLRYGNAEIIESLARELSGEGKIISSAIVNGRKILIFELNDPLVFGKWKIPCIELPYPKTPHEYKDGWEHVEFVIPSDAISLDDFREDLLGFIPELDIEKLTDEKQYSESTPKADSDQLPNPSIILRKEQNLAIKFHPRSIKEIVG